MLVKILRGRQSNNTTDKVEDNFLIRFRDAKYRVIVISTTFSYLNPIVDNPLNAPSGGVLVKNMSDLFGEVPMNLRNENHSLNRSMDYEGKGITRRGASQGLFPMRRIQSALHPPE